MVRIMVSDINLVAGMVREAVQPRTDDDFRWDVYHTAVGWWVTLWRPVEP